MISRPLIRAAVICAVALAFSVAAGPAAAQTASAPPEFDIDTGGWTGGAQGDGDSGRFTHCAISRPYGNGVTLALLMSPRYELNIGLMNPNWNLLPVEPQEAEAETEAQAEASAEEEDEEEEPPIALVSVDGVFEKEFPARPVGESILMVTTGVDDQLVDLLMRGNNLDLATDHGNYRFALTGTFNSITALRGCIDTARRLDAQARAAGPARATPMTDQALVRLLRGAGLENASVATPDSASSPLALSYAWSMGPLTGGLHQSPRQSQQIEIDKFTELYIDQFESTCTQAFRRSEGESQILRDRYALKTATMQCGDDASGFYASLFVALDDGFYTAFFHQGDVSDKALVDDATRQIQRLIQQQAGG